MASAPWADLVPCPVCGAPAGVRCPGRWKAHAGRLALAKEAAS